MSPKSIWICLLSWRVLSVIVRRMISFTQRVHARSESVDLPEYITSGFRQRFCRLKMGNNPWISLKKMAQSSRLARPLEVMPAVSRHSRDLCDHRSPSHRYILILAIAGGLDVKIKFLRAFPNYCRYWQPRRGELPMMWNKNIAAVHTYP
jgi:hypothetical protein